MRPDIYPDSQSHGNKLDENKLLLRVLDSFSTITNMLVAVTDINGQILIASKRGDAEFCRLIKSTPKGLESCQGSYARAGKEAEKWKEPYFFQCHAGLIAWACPILSGDTHETNFICGQVLMWKPEYFYINEIKELAKKNELDSEVLIAAAKQLEVISAERIQATADILFVIANYFANSWVSLLDYQHKLRIVSSWLWNEHYQQTKSLPNSDDTTVTDQIVFNLENQIAREIGQNNIEEARKLLGKMALQFFIRSKGDIEVIKGQSIEFISLFARFATECGIKFEESIKHSMTKLKELEKADTVEQVILWLVTIGNHYIDMLSRKDAKPNEAVIKKAISYIQNNYFSHSLSLQVIASACHISPTYLSRIFKMNMGYSLTDQIKKVRIEEAKHCLQQTDLTIEEIAKNVGFYDRSHFCKVFKQLIGLSPNNFKKRSKTL